KHPARSRRLGPWEQSTCRGRGGHLAVHASATWQFTRVPLGHGLPIPRRSPLADRPLVDGRIDAVPDPVRLVCRERLSRMAQHQPKTQVLLAVQMATMYGW